MANLPLAFMTALVGGLLVATAVQDAQGDPLNLIRGHDKGVANFAGTSSSPAPSSSSSVPGSLPSGGQSHGLVTMAALEAIGRAHGWSGQQITDWMNVVQAESNGTLTDTNPSSGAYGIAQFINGPSEYAVYGGNATTLAGQLTAMANYIAQRYGNPSAAWAHEQSQHWY